MNDQTDKRRAEFERWVTSGGRPKPARSKCNDGYRNANENAQWVGWCAALDAVAQVGDALDARRYRRLQILGCAVTEKQLADGTVSRFSNLDAMIDADIANYPSRGEATTASAQGGEVQAHPDDLAVDRFAVAMKEKLAKKRAQGRGGWEDKAQCTAEQLSKMLIDHIGKGDPVDIANFAMMLHQRGERIEEPERNLMIDRYADIIEIQRRECCDLDPYMVGLYNGMVMMCSNEDGIAYEMLSTSSAQQPVQADAGAMESDLVACTCRWRGDWQCELHAAQVSISRDIYLNEGKETLKAQPPAPGDVEYSEGICGDGAAILRDGQPMSISEIVAALNDAQPPQAPKADAIYAECAEICERVGRNFIHDEEGQYIYAVRFVAAACSNAIRAKMGVG